MPQIDIKEKLHKGRHRMGLGRKAADYIKRMIVIVNLRIWNMVMNSMTRKREITKTQR